MKNHNGLSELSLEEINQVNGGFGIGIIVNQDENLAALVDGTLGKVTINPPTGGWPELSVEVNIGRNT